MDWRTKLLNPTPHARQDYQSLATPVYRGSTVVFNDQNAVTDDWRQAENGYSYGLYGTPTSLELAARIAGIEGAKETFIVPGGQAAIALIYLSYCQAGSHALVPVSAYGPNKAMAEGLMRGLNVDVEPYDPLIGADIDALIRPNTSLIWCESPGSVTMEVQDVPAIVNAAHAKGVAVALDNTYAAGVMFDAFAHGVDVSMQALTKYVGGHSDLLLGTVSARDTAAYDKLGPIYQQLGLAVSPDDCSLALRGLQTLAVRLDVLEQSTLKVAHWLAACFIRRWRRAPGMIYGHAISLVQQAYFHSFLMIISALNK
jgi:cystathionine beta-lyase